MLSPARRWTLLALLLAAGIVAVSPVPYGKAANSSFTKLVPLKPNVGIPIAEWNAAGYCRMLVYDYDCATAPQ